MLDSNSFKKYSSHITGSDSIDVTGGMSSKINTLFEIVTRHPSIRASIFSGAVIGNVQKAFSGENIGTSITDKS